MAQITHEDDMRLYLHSSLLAADVRTPRVSVSFNPEALSFSFKLELSNCRATSGSISVRPVLMDDGFFPCFDYLSVSLARESCRSLLFKFWPQLLDGGLCARTLPLLPSVESRHPPKPNVPSSLLPAVGPPLSSSGEAFPPAI